MNRINACPICNGNDLSPVFSKSAMPIYNLERHYDLKSALDARTGEIDFVYCLDCEFVFNRAFDPNLMGYSIDYESSRGVSDVFNDYLNGLAKIVSHEFDIKDRVVVEIGCGDGQFLCALRKIENFDGHGFDPSRKFNKSHETESDLHFSSEYFSNKSLGGRAPDLLMMRHVLEHQSRPKEFLADLTSTARHVYIEVPAWEWIVNHDLFYAFSYEHCSYFSANSLKLLCGKIGLSPTRIAFGFADEYLQFYAKRVPEENQKTSNTFNQETKRFAQRIRVCMEKAKETFDRYARDSVLWGAAGKGITLLNFMDIDRSILKYAVDSNPNKFGTFVPRTGQLVRSPEDLKHIQPKYILITNPLYRREIESRVHGMGLKSEIIEI